MPKSKIEGFKINPQEMQGTFTANLMTTNEFAEMVNDAFSSISQDYEGCGAIQYDAEFNPYVDLEFSINTDPHAELPENQFRLVEPIGAIPAEGSRITGSRPSALDVINLHNMTAKTTNRLKLTEDCKELFKEFIPRYRAVIAQNINGEYYKKIISYSNKDKIEWNNLYYEKEEQYQYGYTTRKIYGYISIDVRSLLSKFFGNKDANGSYIYFVNDLKNIGPVVNTPTGMVGNRLIMVMKINQKDINEAARSVGMIPNQNNMGIIRVR